MKKTFLIFITVGILVLVTPSCSFTLDGASTKGLKTINVGYFENDAPLVIATLSQDFTEALKAQIRSTTSLSIVRTEQADVSMTGSITGYSIAPVSIQATNATTAPIASASALTVTIQVKYVNNVDKKLSFDQSFSESQNFTGDPASQQNTLLPAIIKALSEDIFNKAFASW
jgi:Lipopolysaccharide-assembly